MTTTSSKERPILFSEPMVRAILDGRKTQTRRVIKPQPATHVREIHLRMYEPLVIRKGMEEPGTPVFGFYDADRGWKCPYGQVGHRLWVRETCWAEELPNGLDGVRYGANNAFIAIENTVEASNKWCDLYAYNKGKGKSVPSIHMPRWASRITLEITGVRVERLNSITNADAMAEGCVASERESESDAFYNLWESINGPGSWDANPWVWVVEFKKESK